PLRLRPKLQPRQSQLSSASAMTPSSLVWSPALPGRAVMRPASIFFWTEIAAKRLGLLHELVPKAVRIAVLLNPANVGTADAYLRAIPEAARTTGLQVQFLNASTSQDIEAALATLARDRVDALLVAGDAFFFSRRVQFATLTARHAIPAAYSLRAYVEAGGLMSYGTDDPDRYRQAGIYTGQI